MLLLLAHTTTATTCSNGFDVPDTYVLKHDETYYKYSDLPMIFLDARTACEADGGYLPMFKTQAQFDAIKDIYQGNQTKLKVNLHRKKSG